MHIDDAVRAMEDAFPMRSYTEKNRVTMSRTEQPSHLTVFKSDEGIANRASYEDNTWETIRGRNQRAYLVTGENLWITDTRFNDVFDSLSLFYGHEDLVFEIRGNREPNNDIPLADLYAGQVGKTRYHSSPPMDPRELQAGMKKLYELGTTFIDSLPGANA